MRPFPLRGFAVCFNQETRSPVVKQYGMCSLVPPEAHSSMLSSQEHPPATFQGSTVRAWLTVQALAIDTCLPLWHRMGFVRSQRESFVCLLGLQSPITTGTLHLAAGLWASAAPLGGTCSPQSARRNSADDGVRITEFLFLKNVTLGKGFGPEWKWWS